MLTRTALRRIPMLIAAIALLGLSVYSSPGAGQSIECPNTQCWKTTDDICYYSPGDHCLSNSAFCPWAACCPHYCS